MRGPSNPVHSTQKLSSKPARILIEPNSEDEDEEARIVGEEEDTGAQIAPIVRLQEVAVTTGEENEDCLLDLKAKLYRFDKEGNQWKERGVGTVKLLKHKKSGKVRLVMRQNKMCQPSGASNNDHPRTCGKLEVMYETFAIRFASVESCKAFREKIEEIAESQGKKDTVEGSAAAELIEKQSKDTEQKPESEKDSTPAKEKENDA
ncbi:scaffold/adaptor protein [Lithospermum erythrorhizon]|uniref:Scaffold/adaptor protein n=1 Tax=Lithospermum erythrorhizon TaxID=34254 RepID=A0AAV3PZF5_LITER